MFNNTKLPLLMSGVIIRDRPVFGFYQYISIGLNTSWQNAVIFLMHPDNLRKKAQQQRKSRQLSYNNASRCGFTNKQTRLTVERAPAVTTETKASSRSFAMLEATRCRCCVRINSRYTSGSFHSTKSLTSTEGAKVQSMPALVQINLKKLVWKMNCDMLSNIYGVMNMIANRYSLLTPTIGYEALASNI